MKWFVVGMIASRALCSLSCSTTILESRGGVYWTSLNDRVPHFCSSSVDFT
jgi:hypothetical protein